MGSLAIVVGIPGVGKTTVLDNLIALCKEKGTKAQVLTMGTMMLDEALARGLVKNRDELRNLTLEHQWDLREATIPRILRAKRENDMTVLDTHFMVRSRGGYLMALPRKFLEGVSPEFFGIVEASVREIIRRRMADKKRARDVVDPKEVRLEKELTTHSTFTMASLVNANVIRVVNKRNQAPQAAKKLYEFFTGGA